MIDLKKSEKIIILACENNKLPKRIISISKIIGERSKLFPHS